jgi:segregation and condensation protein B
VTPEQDAPEPTGAAEPTGVTEATGAPVPEQEPVQISESLESLTTDPEASDFEATSLEATDFEATGPEATESEAIEPEASEPEAADLKTSVTEPSGPDASVTEATESKSADLDSTDPGTSVTELSEPEPSVSEAPESPEEPESETSVPESETSAAELLQPETAEPIAAESTAAEPTAADPTGDDEAIEESALPSLIDDTDLENALEALLLVVDTPVTEETLCSALEQPPERVVETLTRMAIRLTERGSGIDLRRLGDGWRLVTRDRFAPFVEKMLLDGQRAKLTRAALETLAVIAYRQPVTRARVAAVRGVNVDGVIRTLVARGLIQEFGTDSDTGGILYRTTDLFLERLGLSSLEDLPPIAPLLPEVDAIDDV